jgi:nitroimidazol reductase NimA-like FMN-containing flavoprotein (pyridoxamine 5'-phosphate oxidase superfamily)
MAEVNKMTTGKRPAGSRATLAAVLAREPQALRPADHKHALRTLSPAECFGLLELGGIGRVGFAAADGIMMLPVNFAVTGKAIIFRTAADTLLAVYASGPVSFEVDHLDEAHRAAWSVLVHGHAHKVTDERDVRRLEDRTHLEPWAGGARDVYVRIAPTRISGRCIEPGQASPRPQDTQARQRLGPLR